MRNHGWKFLSGAGILLVIVLFAGCGLFMSLGTEDDVTITVTRLERVTDRASDGSTDSKYLVFTKSETFENTDAPLHGKFNSSDLYARLEEGKTYRCKVNGLRVPLFSTYRNLLECEPV